MPKKSTSNLENQLKSTKSLDKFLRENRESQFTDDLHLQLQTILNEKGMTRADVVKACNLNEIYAYQILSGARHPSRDKLLAICIAMELTLKETQKLLRKNGFASLYARIPRDSMLIFGFNHKMTIVEVNQILFSHGEPMLE